MGPFLTPGYLRWDGLKFVTDPNVEIVGPQGPPGPAGQGLANSPAGGDLSGTYPNPLVIGIRGNPVNATVATAGQFLIENSAATASKWTTITGDVTASVSTPGDFTVVALQGTAVSVSAPITNQVLTYNGSVWAPLASQGIVQMNQDVLAGPATTPIAPATVVGAQNGTTNFSSYFRNSTTVDVTSNGQVIGTTVAALSNANTLPAAVIHVISTTGFAGSGTFQVVSTVGNQTITYTGITGTSFTGCTGGTGTIYTGVNVSVRNYTINVISVTGFDATSGTLVVTDAAGPQTIKYTSTGASSFTGCNGGTGTLATGNTVKGTAGFPLSTPPASISMQTSGSFVGYLDSGINGLGYLLGDDFSSTNSTGLVFGYTNINNRVSSSYSIAGNINNSTFINALGNNGISGARGSPPTGILFSGSGGNASLMGNDGFIWTFGGTPYAPPSDVTDVICINQTNFPPSSTHGTLINASLMFALPSLGFLDANTAFTSITPFVQNIFGTSRLQFLDYVSENVLQGGNVTTIAVGSNGATLPQATIHVVSTAGFTPAPSAITVITDAGPQIVYYTGSTSNTFTGCSGGTGTMSTGGNVNSNCIVCTVPFGLASGAYVGKFDVSGYAVINSAGTSTSLGDGYCFEQKLFFKSITGTISQMTGGTGPSVINATNASLSTSSNAYFFPATTGLADKLVAVMAINTANNNLNTLGSCTAMVRVKTTEN